MERGDHVGDTRIDDCGDYWVVEVCDRNLTWILDESYPMRYKTQAEAEEAAESIAEQHGGRFLGVRGVYNR